MKIWADGKGFYGRKSGYALVFEDNRKPIIVLNEEDKTNNEREYEAVIEAFKIANNGDEIYSDSQLVVYQIKGKWKVDKENLRILWQQGFDLLWSKSLQLFWIPRNENKAGKLI